MKTVKITTGQNMTCSREIQRNVKESNGRFYIQYRGQEREVFKINGEWVDADQKEKEVVK